MRYSKLSIALINLAGVFKSKILNPKFPHIFHLFTVSYTDPPLASVLRIRSSSVIGQTSETQSRAIRSSISVRRFFSGSTGPAQRDMWRVATLLGGEPQMTRPLFALLLKMKQSVHILLSLAGDSGPEHSWGTHQWEGAQPTDADREGPWKISFVGQRHRLLQLPVGNLAQKSERQVYVVHGSPADRGLMALQLRNDRSDQGGYALVEPDAVEAAVKRFVAGP